VKNANQGAAVIPRQIRVRPQGAGPHGRRLLRARPHPKPAGGGGGAAGGAAKGGVRSGAGHQVRPAGRWRGDTVVCAASGPSLAQEDIDHVRGRARLIVVNATFRLAPWADALYGADHGFWRVYHEEIVAKFRGECWSVSQQARQQFGLYWIRHANGTGFCTDEDSIHGGGNSGFQAIHLAATFGASRILLLGYDMQRTGGKEHWHGPHSGGLRNGCGFAGWIKAMAPLARDLKQRGVEVLNCSRATALTCFKRATITEALGGSVESRPDGEVPAVELEGHEGLAGVPEVGIPGPAAAG
jgi:hypothetical protein